MGRSVLARDFIWFATVTRCRIGQSESPLHRFIASKLAPTREGEKPLICASGVLVRRRLDCRMKR
jgi:hypothetical protein